MTTIAEHTVDLSLLPEKANILDLGCLGFLFTNHMRSLGHKVTAVDIQDLEGVYLKLAVVANDRAGGMAPIERSKDPQATRVTHGHYSGEWVQTTSVRQLVSRCGFFDLIKMDIEGSEYEVIMSLTEAPATQLSIEFHLHTGIYKDAQVKEMEDRLLSLGYFPVKHDKYPAHGLQANYWDSLFILQK